MMFLKKRRESQEKERQEEYKQRSAETSLQEDSAEEKRRLQEELKQRLLQKYGLANDTERQRIEEEKAAKHAKHVADSHAHEHLGEEEHYEEIIGSLGEINDEGCADLNGVRFVAHDLAYEIGTDDSRDYNRLAQAMVLGEIVNSPRFKSPYSRRK